MTRVLLLGYMPPPYMPEAKVEAAHYRTWQFLQPLLDDGHEVLLCTGPMTAGEPSRAAVPDGLAHERVQFGTREGGRQVQAVHDRFRPECVVAATSRPGLQAARLKTTSPLWLDVYGDDITIQQAMSFRRQNDRGMLTAIGFLRQVLRVGDVISTSGDPQTDMTVGEIAMTGRLTARTFGYRFVRSIPPGCPPIPARDGNETRQALRTSLGLEPDDFVVLWCGGYNTWTDVTTLFAGLERAMASHPRLHFVSVGAATYTARDDVYAQLQASVAASACRDRFHLLGWRPWKEMADFYRLSDVGISIDSLHYETLYGTRTRLVEMIAHGLPVITTRGCELSRVLAATGAGAGFEIGDVAGLASALSLALSPGVVEQMRSAAAELATGRLSFGETTRELRRWVAAPEPAPDKAPQSWRLRVRSTEYAVRAWVRFLLWQKTGKDR